MMDTSRRTSATSTAVRSRALGMDLQASRSRDGPRSVASLVTPNSPRPSSRPRWYLSVTRGPRGWCGTTPSSTRGPPGPRDGDAAAYGLGLGLGRLGLGFGLGLALAAVGLGLPWLWLWLVDGVVCGFFFLVYGGGGGASADSGACG